MAVSTYITVRVMAVYTSIIARVTLDRRVELLRDVVGLSYTEIADSLEVTLATVKWRIYKAREEVQLALAREGIKLGQADEIIVVEPLAR